MSESLKAPEIIARLQEIMATHAADIWPSNVIEVRVKDCELEFVRWEDSFEMRCLKNDLHEAECDIERLYDREYDLKEKIEKLEKELAELKAKQA